MTTPHRTLLPALGLLLALPLAGQDAQASDTPAAERDKTFSVEFQGGSLADYCKLLRSSAGDSASIVAPARAEDVPLPAMELTNVTVHTALEAVTSLAEPKWSMNFRVAIDGVSSPVFAIKIHNTDDHQPTVQGSGPSVSSQVISIAELVRTPPDLDGAEDVALKAESILTAIQSGLSMSPPTDSNRQVVYHEETSLIFVRANRDELRLAESTVQALIRDLTNHRQNVRQQRMIEEANQRRQQPPGRSGGGQTSGVEEEPVETTESPVRRR